MAVVKQIKSLYDSEESVIALLDYITDPSKLYNGLCGGRNVIGDARVSPDMIAEQFIAMQNRRKCRRRLYHLVISFDKILDNMNPKAAYNVAVGVSDLYPNYQSVYAVHEDTPNLHLHIAFNNYPIHSEDPCLSQRLNIWTIQEVVDEYIGRHLY